MSFLNLGLDEVISLPPSFYDDIYLSVCGFLKLLDPMIFLPVDQFLL